ncbi:uncharacterized protein METZ01_LOCUS239581, partial [marine metagenome]
KIPKTILYSSFFFTFIGFIFICFYAIFSRMFFCSIV